MKKTLKTIIIIASSLAIVLLVALAALPLWIGPAVTGVANSVVPDKAKTEFKLDGFYFNQYNGKVEIRGLFLANPKGYDEPVALKVKNIFADVDMSTVLSDTVTINELAIEDVFVSYVFNDGVDNFKRIGDNFSSGGGEEEAAAEISGAETDGSASGTGGSDGETKVIIRKLTLSDVKFKYRSVTIPVPSIELTGIGEKSNGVTMCEILEIIFNSLLETIGSMGQNFGELSAALGDGVLKINDKAGNAVIRFGKDAESLLGGDNLKKLDDGAKKSIDLLKGLFK